MFCRQPRWGFGIRPNFGIAHCAGNSVTERRIDCAREQANLVSERIGLPKKIRAAEIFWERGGTGEKAEGMSFAHPFATGAVSRRGTAERTRTATPCGTGS